MLCVVVYVCDFMPCYKPLKSWQPKSGGQLVFQKPDGAFLLYRFFLLPCGRCIGCRLERSRQWAMRCMHEASLHQDNCFITLTYDDDHMPDHGNLRPEDFQKFMKRWRFQINKNNSGNSQKLRYYMCGEYGDRTRRPHYHACIFGQSFNSDRKLLSTQGGNFLYESETLSKLWPYGHSSFGALTFESAGYVARYCLKKLNGDALNVKDEFGLKPYETIDLSTGEIINLLPEYSNMSLKPAIGLDWYEMFKGDLEKDFITMRGVKMKPPKYYDVLTERERPDFFAELKKERRQHVKVHMHEALYTNRLQVKEQVKLNRIKLLERNI